MKKFKLFSFVAILVTILVLVSCGPEPTPGPGPDPEPTYGEKHLSADTREAIYGVYDAEGNMQGEAYKSLFAAIDYCVNNGDEDPAWYVKKTNDEVKLFVNRKQYASDSADMFWFYENGTSLTDYNCWQATYWQDARELPKAICIFKSGEGNGLSPYANSWDLINVGSVNGKNTTAVWNSCWAVETQSVVDNIAYSGITKSEYTVKLSEARITPPCEDTQDVYAFVGFITADSYNVSNMGLACDATTGEWYYYSGEQSYNSSSRAYDKSEVLMHSKWDEQNNCFVPLNDVKLTCEILTLTDEDDVDYIVNRLTMDFGNGKVVTKDYEISQLTDCGTIRFTTGMDIVLNASSEMTIADYMNGAEFKNVVITEALGTVYPEEEKPYNNVPILNPGVYDLLGSNPESEARFHTILLTTACIETDFATAGKDVYNYSFLITEGPSVSKVITDVIEGIAALPEASSITADNKDAVIAAREAYNQLTKYQKEQVSPEVTTKLSECETTLVTLGVLTGDIQSVVASVYKGDELRHNVNFTLVNGKWVAPVQMDMWNTVSITVSRSIGLPVVLQVNHPELNLVGDLGAYPTPLYSEVDGDWGLYKWGTPKPSGYHHIVYDPDTNTLYNTYSQTEFVNGLMGATATKVTDSVQEVNLGDAEGKFVANEALKVGEKLVIELNYVNGYPYDEEAKQFVCEADKDGYYYFEVDYNTMTSSVDYSEEASEKVVAYVVLNHYDNNKTLVESIRFAQLNEKSLSAYCAVTGQYHNLEVVVNYTLGAPEAYKVTADVWSFGEGVRDAGWAAAGTGIYTDIDNNGDTFWVCNPDADGEYAFDFELATGHVTIEKRVFMGVRLTHQSNTFEHLQSIDLVLNGDATAYVGEVTVDGQYHNLSVELVFTAGPSIKLSVVDDVWEFGEGVRDAGWAQAGTGLYTDVQNNGDTNWICNPEADGTYRFTYTIATGKVLIEKQ